MENLPGLMGAATPVGTILLAVLLIYFGKLVPSPFHNYTVAELTKARDAAIKRAEVAEGQVRELTSTLSTHTHLLQAIRDQAEQKEETP